MDHINKTYIELDQDMDTNLLKMCLNMMIVMSNKQHLRKENQENYMQGYFNTIELLKSIHKGVLDKAMKEVQ